MSPKFYVIRYIFEKADREVIPVKGPSTELEKYNKIKNTGKKLLVQVQNGMVRMIFKVKIYTVKL